jgi:hypothetical protein
MLIKFDSSCASGRIAFFNYMIHFVAHIIFDRVAMDTGCAPMWLLQIGTVFKVWFCLSKKKFVLSLEAFAWLVLIILSLWVRGYIAS